MKTSTCLCILAFCFYKVNGIPLTLPRSSFAKHSCTCVVGNLRVGMWGLNWIKGNIKGRKDMSIVS